MRTDDELSLPANAKQRCLSVEARQGVASSPKNAPRNENKANTALSNPDATGDWKKICALAEIPRLGARVVKAAHGDIAIFRNADDEVFALADRCPHKGGPLSQGIVFGRHVSCPLHQWIVCLDSGRAQEPDEGCAKSFLVRVVSGEVFLQI